MAFKKSAPTHNAEDLFDEEHGDSSYSPNGAAWRKEGDFWTIKRDKLSSARKVRLRSRGPSDSAAINTGLTETPIPTHIVEEVIRTDAGYRYRPVGKAWPLGGGDLLVDLEKSTDSKTLRLRPIKP